MKRNTKQTKNDETNEIPKLFVCSVIFRLFRVSLQLSLFKGLIEIGD
jgi:hypothetical protein